MQVLTDDAIWKIAVTAKEAAQAKSEWIRHSARTAAEVAVDVVANFTTENVTKDLAEKLETKTARGVRA